MFDSVRHVILDRDGVLNEERGDGGYVERWSQWRWISGALQALGTLGAAGIRLSVVTNQAGVARGLVEQDELDAIHTRMTQDAAGAGGVISSVFVCPHTSNDGCDCRKPAPGLLLRAVAAAGIPPAATIAVGDDLRDLQAARAAGITAVLVRTGKGQLTEAKIGYLEVPVFDDLRAFASAIVAKSQLTLEQPV